MSEVHVFPGQGSQVRGMGAGLFERFPDLVAEADDVVGYSIAELCLEDRDGVMGQTEYTQPALYVVNALHYLAWIADGGQTPAVVAGHSLGEYCALFAAGAFDFVTGLRLVSMRGELMSRAPPGGMAAVVRLEPAHVAQILATIPSRAIDIANLNGPDQCILAGQHDDLLDPELQAAFRAAGGMVLPLNVSAAFHSRCMTGVQAAFSRGLASFAFGPLTIPVVANVTARPFPATGYEDLLVRQICSPVRWYESVSWLLAQGHHEFREIGPGTVLTRLVDKIRARPLAVSDGKVVAPAAGSIRRAVTPTAARRGTRVVFMYGGQGTQYHHMGRALYDEDPVFRRAMDRGDARYAALGGVSLVGTIYDGVPRGTPLDDLHVSHAALYVLGCSLTETLREQGFGPDAVLGHSMGEYVAATVAGAITFDEGLRLVGEQARLVASGCAGGMMSVLADAALYERRPGVFGGLALAGVNYAGNFVVSGEGERLEHARMALDEEGVMAVRLPVRQPFHSPLLDVVRDDHVAVGRAVTARRPTLPSYSSMVAGPLGDDALEHWEGYVWDVIRQPVRFDALIASTFSPSADQLFVDLSASGTLANFLKHGHGGAYRCAAALSPFERGVASMTRLREALAGVSR